MCGIFGIFNYEHIDYNNAQYKSLSEFVSAIFNTAAHRGPDNSILVNDSVSHSFLGFHRLTINGSAHYYGSNQPIYKNDIILLCNGEIYNYNTLLNELDLTPAEKEKHSGSDCEIIIDLYLKYGMDTTVELLDGAFAFILMDMRCLSQQADYAPKIYVARDPFGLRPLYWLKHTPQLFDGDYPEQVGTCMPFGFASEMKQLAPIVQNGSDVMLTVEPFQPGHYACYTGTMLTDERNYLQKDAPTFQKKVAWLIQPSSINVVNYFTFPHFRQLNHINHATSVSKIKDYLINAVDKRLHCTDRPIACLLSGGIDSSLICGIIRKLLPKDKPLETYSIGMAGASDKEYIKLVSQHIKSTHTHVEASKEEFLSAIPDVIRLLETYDTTTVRASVGNYLIAKHISENSDAKVIFNGDGSDELFGGYKYFLNCPDKYEFNRERKRLLKDIHYFDVLRSERSISVNGLEARTPFLDKELVSYVMTLCHDLTFTYDNATSYETEVKNTLCTEKHKACVFEAMKKTGIEKWMLRCAFIDSNIIPRNILTRSKEAFSDGVSSETDSWYIIIQKQIIKMICHNARRENTRLLIPLNVFLTMGGGMGLSSESVNADNYETNTYDASSLLCDNLLDRIFNCYRKLFCDEPYDDTLSETECKATMLLAEKWYYRAIYDYYYAGIDTIPYYWMPKYTTETNDPSARTLGVYADMHSSLTDAEKEDVLFNKILLRNVISGNSVSNVATIDVTKSFC